jgi:hypothetical protein
MNALDQLNSYLRRIESRLRLMTVSRGSALIALAALCVTVLLVVILNSLAFSHASVLVARVLLFLSVAAAVGFGLVIPLLRMNRRNAARQAEARFPEFEERLLTVAEQPADAGPFAQLLAADTMKIAEVNEPEKLASTPRIVGLLTSAGVAVSVLLWLIVAGPGFLGYGTSLLWAGSAKVGAQPLYDIFVKPGDATVRRKSDQWITAHLVNFDTRNVRLFARLGGASKWDQVNMAPQPGGSSYEFLFSGLADNVEYYVEAGTLQSKHYNLKVVDLPGVKRVKVTYHYPAWSGMKDSTEDPGGDLRAVQGTVAEVAVQMDRPLSKGVLQFSDDKQIELKSGEGNWYTARVPLEKDGMYHVAAIESGENVRLSEDFFIEAKKDEPPTVKITRPGRDAKVNPIEEVTVTVEGSDDFGLQELGIHYSVNGGPEQTAQVLPQKGVKSASGSQTIYLENFKLSPGDLVSVYATARDAQHSVKSDILFVEAQPFEREYSQSQQMGGGGGGQGQQDNEISEREKEIIAATWNEQKGGSKDAATAREDARFLSDLQSKLGGQSKALADRMRSRMLSNAGEEFKTFTENMEQASAAMTEAADKLKSQKWTDAMQPEQKALQHILRAESVFRQIQVAFGQRGGGGGGGGSQGRDLENMFDLELDTEKNQYETGQQSSSASDRRQEEIDKALERLKQLAQRQQELASQKQHDQSFQQRWEQEMLRREAEELKRQIEQLQRGDSSQQSQSQSQSSSSSSSSSSSGQSSSSKSGQSSRQQQQQNGQDRNSNRRQQATADPRLQQALDRLTQAEQDMRQAASAQQGGNSAENSAAGRRAAERLKEAQDLINGMQRQESASDLNDMVKQAEQLTQHQQDFQNRLRQMYGNSSGGGVQPGQSQAQAQRMAGEKEREADDLKHLEKEMQDTARQTRESDPAVSTKLREALGQMQQDELALRMKKSAEWIRDGQGMYTWMRESVVTQGLDRLRQQLQDAAGLAGRNGQNAGAKDPKKSDAERSLAQLENLRNQMERLARGQRGGQNGQNGQNGQEGADSQGQQQGGRQQGGQQQGGQQAGGQQPGQQQGGQQQGGQQQGGQQAGGQQQGGQQQGGQQGGGQQAGSQQYGGGPNGSPGAHFGGGGYGWDYTWREGVRDLSEVRRWAQGTDPDLSKEAQDLLRQLQQMRLGEASEAELAQRLNREVLPGLEQLEVQLRRQVEQQNAGQVRTGTSDAVPTGYADSVAEYFRRLSKGK